MKKAMTKYINSNSKIDSVNKAVYFHEVKNIKKSKTFMASTFVSYLVHS